MHELLDLLTKSGAEMRALVDQGAWLAVAALLIALLARAAKEPRFFGGPLARIPRERRPYVIAALGLLSGVLEAAVRGVSWPRAIAQGALSAGLAMLGHGLAGGVSPETAPASPAKGTVPPVSAVVVETTIADLPPTPRVTPFTATPPQDLDFADDPKPSSSGGPS